MKIYVTIRGPVGSMKSPIAKLISEAIANERPDLSCTVFDHQLYEGDAHFEDALKRVQQDAVNSPHNVCVVVINTATEDKPLAIEVEPAVLGATVIFRAVTSHLRPIGWTEG
jgi:hypothetical protein